MRGYFGIALYKPKNAHNYGSLIRTANILGAKFICIIGRRFKHQASDTLKTERHIPVFEYETFEEFNKNRPYSCKLIGVELANNARLIDNYSHPQQAIYLFGSEDNGIPDNVLEKCNDVIKLRGKFSMNLAVAGSIVIYDRTKE